MAGRWYTWTQQSTFGIFRPRTGQWWVKGGLPAHGSYGYFGDPGDWYAEFGQTSADLPVTGDWAGSGFDKIAIYRPDYNTFYLRFSNTSGPPDWAYTYGSYYGLGDRPVVGDWNGDGFQTAAVFRTGPREWFAVDRMAGDGLHDLRFRVGCCPYWAPIAGDWDNAP